MLWPFAAFGTMLLCVKFWLKQWDELGGTTCLLLFVQFYGTEITHIAFKVHYLIMYLLCHKMFRSTWSQKTPTYRGCKWISRCSLQTGGCQYDFCYFLSSLGLHVISVISTAITLNDDCAKSLEVNWKPCIKLCINESSVNPTSHSHTHT